MLTVLPTGVPLPGSGPSDVAIAAPGAGPGFWAGAPSAVVSDDGVSLAYRLRRPVAEGRGYAVAIAHSTDGVRFTEVNRLTKDEFDTDSLERPALVRLPDGRWRIYVSSATPGTLHWRIDAIDAASPAQFRAEDRVPVTFGDPDNAYKDPVVLLDGEGWRMWVCRHIVDPPADADAMTTLLATSDDGLDWTLDSVALGGRPDHWDARGARVSAVLPGIEPAIAYYDGRASAAENWEERTGVARQIAPGQLASLSAEPVGTDHGSGSLRYVSVVRLNDGLRLYYEATQPDGSHALRSEYAPLPSALSQSE